MTSGCIRQRLRVERLDAGDGLGKYVGHPAILSDPHIASVGWLLGDHQPDGGWRRGRAGETFDRDFWEQRWARALREDPDAVVSRLPKAHLVAEVDPATGPPSPAAGQTQVSVEDATSALDADEWEVVVAEERPRAAAGSGADAVIRAVCRIQDVSPVSAE